MLSVNRAIHAAMHPITGAPTCAVSTVGTTPKLLTADISDTSHQRVRRLRLVNEHASNVLTLLISESPGFDFAASGLTANDGIRILPRSWIDISVRGDFSLGVVGDAAATAYSFTIETI